MSTAQQARDAINVAGLDRFTALAVALVGGLETHWGSGWDGTAGAGSHNWGAETGTGDAGSFEHRDSRPGDPSKGEPAVVQYVTHFAAYPDDVSAALGLAGRVQKGWPLAIEAIRAGDWGRFSVELYGRPGHRYYTGTSQIDAVNIARHQRRVSEVANTATFQAAFGDLLQGLPKYLPPPPVGPRVRAGVVFCWGSWGSVCSRLRAALGLSRGSVIDYETHCALLGAQRSHGLAVDGLVGPRTREALGI